MTKHRVELVQRINASLNLSSIDTQLSCKFLLSLLVVWNELVQWWVEQTDGDRQSVHRGEDSCEVLTLERKELGECFATLVFVFGNDHLTDGQRSLTTEEHVLRTAESDPLSAKFAGTRGIVGRVGVGANGQGTVLVSPLHQTSKVAGQASWQGSNAAFGNFSGGTVDAQFVLFAVGLAVDFGSLGLHVDLNSGCTGDAATAPTTSNNGCVTGHTTGAGQNTSGSVHSVDIFGAGFLADQDDVFASGSSRLGVFRSEGQLTNGCTRRGRQASCDRLNLGPSGWVEAWKEKLRQVTGRDAHDSGLFVDQPFVNHFTRETNCGHTCSLPVPGLQHVQLALLDRELDVLHVLVVLLELVLDFHQFLIDGVVPLAHLFGWRWSADTSHNVFTLSVDQELTKELILAGVRVAGERDASSGVVAHVAVNHRLAVDCGAEQATDAFDLAVLDRFVGHPALEDRLDRFGQLVHWILREVFTGVLLVKCLVGFAQFLEPFGWNVGVFFGVVLLLDRVERFFEMLVLYFHHNVAEHVD